LNQKKDELFGHLTGNTPKGVVWYLKEANFIHGISVGRQLATSTRPQYPPEEFDDEPIGLEFMHYRDWDKIQKMLVHESAFNNGGVELPFGDETVGLDDDDDDIGPDAAALTDDIGPDAVACADDTKVSKEPKQAYCHSSGGATWNRKEGSISRQPPTRQIAQLPLNSGQQLAAANILSHICTNSSSQATSTINATANEFSNEWNRRHFGGLLEGASSHGLGGTMSIPVAQKLVGWISKQSAAQRYGAPTASQNLNRTAAIAANPESSRPRKPHKPRKTLELESIPILGSEELTESVLAQMGQKELRAHIKACGIKPEPANNPERRRRLLDHVNSKPSASWV
jgi:hypothetical protein